MLLSFAVATVGFEQELYVFAEPVGTMQRVEQICTVMTGNLRRLLILQPQFLEGSATGRLCVFSGLLEK